ncbi:MAG TPA: gamma-glutamyl-gamma-aminobutyrate hydrolase family protein [Gaiellales bacterium]|jgi:gamma-glutamyl-gamma-aminobutyrate hydrolase PuuD
MKPLIGVSTSFRDVGDYLGEGYQRPIAMAGGLPVTLPRLEEAVDDLLDRVDGLMIAAGHDIDPARYGQEPHALLGPLDPARDAFELDLIRRAVDRGMPIIGACRGMQALNVALGGTMLQDLSLDPAYRGHPSDATGRYWRRFKDATMAGAPVPEHPRHPIGIEPGSLLHELTGAEEAEVDSFHHQAVDRIGEGLVVSARASDGVIEALEMPGRFVLAMQCELHEGWRWDDRWLGVFRAFVAAAADRRAAPAA